jgi:hypothetical protein
VFLYTRPLLSLESSVSGGGLDGRGSYPGRRSYLFSLNVLTNSGAHSASYPMGTRDSFPGVKPPGRETGHSAPSIAEVDCVTLYLHSPITPSWRGAQKESTRTTLTLPLRERGPFSLG